MLLRCIEAVALIISLHGIAIKQLDAFRRASKEKILAYVLLDAVGAPLVEPDEAERLGKRVQERVRTVNESIEAEEKFAKARAKAKTQVRRKKAKIWTKQSGCWRRSKRRARLDSLNESRFKISERAERINWKL